jgi:hypothetical protein
MFDQEDDDEDFTPEPTRDVRKKLKQRAREEFIQGCYSAYDILEREGKKALDKGDLTSICRAINRMMSLFLIQEEYERCSFLKQYVESNIPGHIITPDPQIQEELKD